MRFLGPLQTPPTLENCDQISYSERPCSPDGFYSFPLWTTQFDEPPKPPEYFPCSRQILARWRRIQESLIQELALAQLVSGRLDFYSLKS